MRGVTAGHGIVAGAVFGLYIKPNILVFTLYLFMFVQFTNVWIILRVPPQL